MAGKNFIAKYGQVIVSFELTAYHDKLRTIFQVLNFVTQSRCCTLSNKGKAQSKTCHGKAFSRYFHNQAPDICQVMIFIGPIISQVMIAARISKVARD